MAQRTANHVNSKPGGVSYVFGPFCLSPSERTLLRQGEPVALTPKAFEILTVLVRNSGHLVGKEELMREVWPDAFVEEANITQHVSMLRKALDDETEDHHYIETVPRSGYRFVASVRETHSRDLEILQDHVTSSSSTRQELITKPPSEASEGRGTQQQALTATWWTNARLSRSARALAALVIFVGLAFAITYFWMAGGQKQPETAAAMRTIAVLPFKSIGEEGDNEYVELGMADALITRLSNIRGIVVRPTSSVSKYARLQQDAVMSGRELGVEAVLDGSVQKINDRIRLTVRLIRTKDAASLWAETFDEKWTDVLSVQSSIAQKVAEALALKLTGEERRLLAKRYTDNAVAYQLYLKGRYSSNKWTVEGSRKGIEFFNQAIALDPDYALAYAGLADCYQVLSFWMPPSEMMPKMKEMATKAVALDPSLAEAHSSLSVALQYHDLDWVGAEREGRRAVELNPNNARSHLSYGDLLSTLGRFDEAAFEFKKAQELDPTSGVVTGYLAYHLVRSGDYDRAIEESQKALELEPDNDWPSGAMSYAYLYKGEPAKALILFQRANQTGAVELEGIGRAYAAMGERAKALKIIDGLRDASKREYVSSFPIATIYLQLGDKNKAIEYLEKTYEERNTVSLSILKTDKQFDPLRSDPRFIKLMRQLNFEP
jgi:DNA-binding winged helix-turn-helix (wHTH) protein/TolB-like protein/Flp pilus assembly protein TadD